MILFTPVNIGKKTAKNRIVSSAHGEHLAQGGILTDHIIQYHARRAVGGAGVIIAFGSGSVTPTAASHDSVALWKEENEAPLRRLADLVHAEGALILAQATHRAAREVPMSMDDVLQGPSTPPGSYKQGYYGALHVLSEDEIRGIIANYETAARRLARCGWDGIEITALGTHLIEHFWSPVLNTRTDAYGGDFERRMRFSLEILRAVADATPDDFLIAFRFSADLATEELGLTFADITRIARRLDEEGIVSFFDISGGSGFDVAAHAAAVPPEGFPLRTYGRFAKELKSQLSVPVMTAGRMIRPEDAEAALAAGECDLVAMTRALIADPDLPRATSEGRADTIRPCIAINEGCRRVTIGRSLACSVNAAVADPRLSDFHTADTKRHVRIIGGGPAGMETARVAAQRGHLVTLYEQTERLGGQMHAFAALAGWPYLLNHVAWLERELDRLGVEVVLGKAVGAGDLQAWNDEVVVMGTGARTCLPPEADAVASRAVTDVDLLERPELVVPGANVVVIDIETRLRGAKAALLAKRLGAGHVSLYFGSEFACDNLEPPNRPGIYRALHEAEIAIRPHRHLSLRGEADTLVFRNPWSGGLEPVAADLYVFSGYRRSVDELFATHPDALDSDEVHMVGDCRAPRLLRNAVSEGVRAGVNI